MQAQGAVSILRPLMREHKCSFLEFEYGVRRTPNTANRTKKIFRANTNTRIEQEKFWSEHEHVFEYFPNCGANFCVRQKNKVSM